MTSLMSASVSLDAPFPRAARLMLASLVTTAGPRDRETEAEKARERSRLRFAQ